MLVWLLYFVSGTSPLIRLIHSIFSWNILKKVTPESRIITLVSYNSEWSASYVKDLLWFLELFTIWDNENGLRGAVLKCVALIYSENEMYSLIVQSQVNYWRDTAYIESNIMYRRSSNWRKIKQKWNYRSLRKKIRWRFGHINIKHVNSPVFREL